MPPVLLHNRRARAAVRVSRALPRPAAQRHARSHRADGARLPLMVGAMVGDVAYGALLLAASLFVRRRFGPRSAAVRDLAGVFVAGAVWAIVFGFLFGEALGDLGHRLGLPALWFYRGRRRRSRAAASLVAGARSRTCRARDPARALAVGAPAAAGGAARTWRLIARAVRCLCARWGRRRPASWLGGAARGARHRCRASCSS